MCVLIFVILIFTGENILHFQKLLRDGLNNLYLVQPIMNDDEDEYSVPNSGLEMGDSINSETHDDVDPFEELGIGSRTHKTTTNVENKDYDALSDLMDDDTDDIQEEGVSEENGVEKSTAESTYLMLLQTVWVDGILDPAEVRLLAKKRVDLNISFDRHLELVTDLIG